MSECGPVQTVIVLVNHKNDVDTVECVESLALLAKESFSVVIVDNGGTHTLLDRLRASAGVVDFFHVFNVFDGKRKEDVGAPGGCVRSIAVVDNVRNNGFSAANNVGARIARDVFAPEYFWFLNNDTTVDTNALSALSDAISPRIKAVGSKICFYHDRATVQTLGGGDWFLVPHHASCGKRDSSRFRTRRHFGFIDGCSFFVEADIFFGVGCWDEAFFMYGEDVDLSERIKRAGYHLAFCAESRVFHKGGGSLQRKQRLAFFGPVGVMRFDYQSYFKNVIPETRNRRYLTYKHRGLSGLFVYFLFSPFLFFVSAVCVFLFDDRKLDRCAALAKAYWGRDSASGASSAVLCKQGQPDVSVVMAAYNAVNYIDEAIGSILSQSFTNFELIVVDDCSTDGTYDKLMMWAKKDSRIKLFRNGENKGHQSSVIVAVSHANAPFLAKMDADDVALPQRLAVQTEFFRNHEDVDIVGGQADCFDDFGQCYSPHYPLTHNEIRRRMLFSCGMPFGTMMFSRRVAGELVSLVGQSFFADHMAQLVLSRHFRMANVPQVVLRYRMHEQSITHRWMKNPVAGDPIVAAAWSGLERGVPVPDAEQLSAWERVFYFSKATKHDYSVCFRLASSLFVRDILLGLTAVLACCRQWVLSPPSDAAFSVGVRLTGMLAVLSEVGCEDFCKILMRRIKKGIHDRRR